MDKDAVIAILRAHRAELEQLGIRHAALFGSVARGTDGPSSDVDVAVLFEESPPARLGGPRLVLERELRFRARLVVGHEEISMPARGGSIGPCGPMRTRSHLLGLLRTVVLLDERSELLANA